MASTSLRKMLPQGLFGITNPMGKGCTQSSMERLNSMEVGGTRKRLREEDPERGGETKDTGSTDPACRINGNDCNRTPKLLVCSRKRVELGVNEHQLDHGSIDRPIKRFRGEIAVLCVSAPKQPTKKLEAKPQSGRLGTLPEDVLSHCLSFLNGVEDRYVLQTTCKQFRKISNSDKMLVNIKVGGDRETGKNGIIQVKDSPESAAVALAPFSRSGNLEAIYMLGMIKSYCHQDVETGICLLKKAATNGYVRSSYALGLVLRDSQPEDANMYMQLAAGEGYLPALQELLPAREMKAKYGEPNADELRRHLDPICLNLLLGRHYVHSAELRELNTSHCWNPLCGRWAFKASVSTNATTLRIRRTWGLTFYRNGDGEAQPLETGVENAVAVVVARTENNLVASGTAAGSGVRIDDSMPLASDANASDEASNRNDRNDNIADNPSDPTDVSSTARSNEITSSVGAGGVASNIDSGNRTANDDPRAGSADTDFRVDSSGTSDESSPQPGNQNHNESSSSTFMDVRVSRMKMCSRCCRAKYCSKLCQVYDWRSGRHKMECQFL